MSAPLELPRTPRPARPALPSAARAGLLAAGLLFAACAPEQVDMNVHDIFSGDSARYALQTQMPPATLAALGGFLPADTWPSDAPPLLLDVQVIAENKIDLAGSNIIVTDYSGLRLHWAQLVATALSDGPLAPVPTKVEMYVGPASSTSLTDPGVLPLAAGALPETLPAASCDAGLGCLASDAGSSDAGTSDAGDADAGSSDAGAPDAGLADAGTADAGAADAGSPVDAGAGDAGTSAGSSDAGVAGQTLVFSADAQLALQKLVFAGQPFALFVVLHIPIDTATNPALPTGGADLSFDVQFELAR